MKRWMDRITLILRLIWLIWRKTISAPRNLVWSHCRIPGKIGNKPPHSEIILLYYQHNLYVHCTPFHIFDVQIHICSVQFIGEIVLLISKASNSGVVHFNSTEYILSTTSTITVEQKILVLFTSMKRPWLKNINKIQNNLLPC